MNLVARLEAGLAASLAVALVSGAGDGAFASGAILLVLQAMKVFS